MTTLKLRHGLASPHGYLSRCNLPERLLHRHAEIFKMAVGRRTRRMQRKNRWIAFGSACRHQTRHQYGPRMKIGSVRPPSRAGRLGLP